MSQSVKRLLPASNQLICLDVLRLIASITIMVYHFAGQLEFGPKQSPPTWIGQLNVAVDLFFLISGYVIIRFYGSISTLEGYRSFLWKRLARLYPLHLVTALSFVAIGLAAVVYGMPLRLGSEQFNLSCLPANLLLIHSLKFCPYLTFNQASWSISAEMLLYLSLPLVLVIRRTRFLPLILAVVGFVALWLAGPDGSTRPWFDRTYDYGVLRAAPSFLVGVAAYDHRHLLARIYRPEMSMWAVLVLVLGLAIAGAPGTLLVALLFISAACAIAADGQEATSRIARWLSPWGALTYSLYLLHPLVDIILISFIGKKNLHLQGAYLNFFIIFAGLITFFTAYCSYVWFEDPARRMLTRLGGWRERRAVPADSHTPL